MFVLPSAVTAAAATPPRAFSQYGSRSSSSTIVLTRMPPATVAPPSKCARRNGSVSVVPVRAMAPFRNPFKSKPKEKEEKGISGMKVLLDKVQKGSEKAKKEGFQEVLADVRDGISQRNYGNGGSWPEAAEARRKMECPRCGASTAEAVAAAESAGVVVNPMGDPVEQAAAGQHPLGWCKECAENNRLLDTSGGF